MKYSNAFWSIINNQSNQECITSNGIVKIMTMYVNEIIGSNITFINGDVKLKELLNVAIIGIDTTNAKDEVNISLGK